MRLKVTKLAKERAKVALESRRRLPNSKKYGLDSKEAQRLGINSGVERAKQLIRSKYVSYEDAKRICAFKRHLVKNPSQRRQGAIGLWGGEKFIMKACKHTQGG
jgi:hypothetical protein